MNKKYFEGFKSEANLEDAIQAFSHLVSYFPLYEPGNNGSCRAKETKRFLVHRGDSILCDEEGVECIAFAVVYGSRIVCLLEATIPDYKKEVPFEWTPVVLSQVSYIESVDYNGLFLDFHEDVYEYIIDNWDYEVV